MFNATYHILIDDKVTVTVYASNNHQFIFRAPLDQYHLLHGDSPCSSAIVKSFVEFFPSTVSFSDIVDLVKEIGQKIVTVLGEFYL